MALTVSALIQYTTSAHGPVYAGISYIAFNKSEGWGIVSEAKDDGSLTGRICVVCDDNKVLRGFIKEMRQLGHKVETPLRWRLKNTVFVTLRS